MRVLVHVRGTVGELDLWPYALSAEPVGDGALLNVDVVDGRELVGVLVALVERGLDIVRVETLGPPPRAIPQARARGGSFRPGEAFAPSADEVDT
jgi:hypothetical protein